MQGVRQAISCRLAPHQADGRLGALPCCLMVYRACRCRVCLLLGYAAADDRAALQALDACHAVAMSEGGAHPSVGASPGPHESTARLGGRTPKHCPGAACSGGEQRRSLPPAACLPDNHKTTFSCWPSLLWAWHSQLGLSSEQGAKACVPRVLLWTRKTSHAHTHPYEGRA